MDHHAPNPHWKASIEEMHNLCDAAVRDPQIQDAAQQMANGLQYLAISAALGKSPTQLQIQLPPCKP